jgi:xylulokinase
MDVKPRRVRLTGGASKNNGIAGLVADVFQAPVERLDVSNSAALGAALIAAAADGNDLDSLQQVFCRCSAGSTLAPDPAMALVYQDALVRFAGLLDSNRSK